jgi:hypothetical protein
MQGIPVDDDFPAADAEKTAEVDHSRAHRTAAVDDYVDDPAHSLVRRAADITAEHAMCIRRPDDGDGGWRHGLLGRDRGRGGWRWGVATRLRRTFVIGRPRYCGGGRDNSDRDEH